MKGGSILKTGIFGNCVFATFSKNIKHLTFAGCQSEIPLNSSRFRMNRKFCYQSATKFSTLSRIGVEVSFTRKLEVSDFSGAVGNYLEKFDGTLPSLVEVQPFFMKPNLPLPIPADVILSLVITFGCRLFSSSHVPFTS